jgi:DNA-binding NarL/FixJ family response regulator
MATPIPPVEPAGYERSVAAARAQLGEQAFALLWNEGRTMSPEQALTAQGSSVLLIKTLKEYQAANTEPQPSSQPIRLTTRERDVLHLLTMGLTSAQIAEQLVVSLPTVNTHVRSIYNKLGVASRSAATRYAVEHHLT